MKLRDYSFIVIKQERLSSAHLVSMVSITWKPILDYEVLENIGVADLDR